MKFKMFIKIKMAKMDGISRFKSPKPVINVKILFILTLLSRRNFMLSRVEHEFFKNAYKN